MSVYRWERIPRDASGRIANDVFEPPDLIVEIASPEQSVNALVRRCMWYVANGVQVAMLVDPADESVVAFRSGGGLSDWRDQNRIDVGEVLPDFALTVEELFASLH
jgi:Uma2 family endonuclease